MATRRQRLNRLALLYAAAQGTPAQHGRFGAQAGALAAGSNRLLALSSALQRSQQQTQQQRQAGAGLPFNLNVNIPGIGNIGNILEAPIKFPFNLARGAGEALYNLPTGAIETGSALVEAAKEGSFEPIQRRILEPIGQQYSQTYSPLFRGDFEQFARGVYQEPIGPVLDALTVASLGAGGLARGGAAVSRVGQGTSRLSRIPGATEAAQPFLPVAQRLAGLRSPSGRAPLELRGGITNERLLSLSKDEIPNVEKQLTATEAKLADAQKRGDETSVQRYQERTNALSERLTRLTELTEPGVGVPTIGRYYSTSPVRRQIQKRGIDPLLERPVAMFGEGFRALYEKRAQKTEAKRAESREKIGRTEAINAAIRPLIEVRNRLDDRERVAVGLLLQGIGRMELPRYQERVRESFEKGGGQLTEDVKAELGIRSDEEAAARAREILEIDEETINLLENPTEGMIEAAQRWHDYVEADLGPEGRLGISPEENVEYALQAFRSLRGKTEPGEFGEGVLKDLLGEARLRERPIQPTYFPQAVTRGIREVGNLQGPRRTVVGQAAGAVRDLIGRARTQGGAARRAEYQVTRETLFRNPKQAYLEDNALIAWGAGQIDLDFDAVIRHAAQRERDLSTIAFRQDVIASKALKDASGEMVKVDMGDAGAVSRLVGADAADNWTAIPMDQAIQWYKGEVDIIKKTFGELSRMRDEGIADAGKISDELDALFRREGRAASLRMTYLGAKRNEGIVLPAEYVDYTMRILKANEPFENKLGRGYAYLLNKWRTMTLAYMPRWYVNTIVGTAMLNILKGVWNPIVYVQAWHLRNSGALPAGTRLGASALQDVVEPGVENISGVFPTRRLYQGAQRIEDYFRTASLIHGANKANKQALAEGAGIVQGWNDRLLDLRGRAFERALKDEDGFDPETVELALNDLDRFAYNYNLLGPAERRWLRMAVPFWGWYKFVTKLIWSAPVEMPARLNAMTQLGQIGQNSFDDIGVVPPNVLGAIILNMGADKKLTYLGARGLNPFATFINPADPLRGGVTGVLDLGQLAPPIQAFLGGAGVDTFGGGTVGFSPDTPVEPDFFGQLINTTTGEEVDPKQVSGWRRFIGTLLRSSPQVRSLEQYAAGGRPVFPESVPFPGQVRPIPVKPETRRTPEQLILQQLGINIREKDIETYQRLLKKRHKFSGTRHTRRQKQLEELLR